MHALSFAIRGQLDSDGILREALETGDSPCNDEMPSKGQSKTNLLYSFAARRFLCRSPVGTQKRAYRTIRGWLHQFFSQERAAADANTANLWPTRNSIGVTAAFG